MSFSFIGFQSVALLSEMGLRVFRLLSRLATYLRMSVFIWFGALGPSALQKGVLLYGWRGCDDT